MNIYNKDTFINLNLYIEKGQLIAQQYFNIKKVNTSTNYLSYNEMGKLATLNKKGKQSYKYEYDYFENGSRKEMRYYNGTKLKKVYSYACEPTGTLEKNITQQNICKKRTYNADSSYVEIYDGKDNKGHIRRRIVKYTKDSLEVEETYFNKNDKELIRKQYVYQEKNMVKITSFYKGKLTKTTDYSFS
jgi:hypothetical protein